jgi:hypothetical protein
MKRIAVLLLLTIFLSCSSPARLPGIKLVGNISLVSVPTKYDHSYQLVLQNKQGATPLLVDYVIEIYGNDTAMVLKCIGSSGAVNYFKLAHLGGYDPAPAVPIRVAEYKEFRDTSPITFNFTDDVRYNWK